MVMNYRGREVREILGRFENTAFYPYSSSLLETLTKEICRLFQPVGDMPEMPIVEDIMSKAEKNFNFKWADLIEAIDFDFDRGNAEQFLLDIIFDSKVAQRDADALFFSKYLKEGGK